MNYNLGNTELNKYVDWNVFLDWMGVFLDFQGFSFQNELWPLSPTMHHK